MSSKPTYAVIPGMPSTPRAVVIGSLRSSTRSSLPADTPCVCQPSYPATTSPARKPGFFDSMTSLTVCPTITPPIATDAAYDGASLMRPAHVGIEREIERPPQHLAVSDGLHRRLGDLENPRASACRAAAA
jgi:hypothetical protein